jgi:hypothetical protein
VSDRCNPPTLPGTVRAVAAFLLTLLVVLALGSVT